MMYIPVFETICFKKIGMLALYKKLSILLCSVLNLENLHGGLILLSLLLCYW